METTQNEDPEDRLGMTEVQWEWFQRFTRGYGDQDEDGDDIPIKMALHRLSPSERADFERRMEPFYEELRQAATKARHRAVHGA